MRKFDRVFFVALLVIAVAFAVVNIMMRTNEWESGRFYRVEAERLAKDIESGKPADVSSCDYVTGVIKYEGQSDFYNADSDYLIKEINGETYRFDYNAGNISRERDILIVNLVLAGVAVFTLLILIYIRLRILAPFNRLSSVPYDLSKGKLTSPLEENKSRYFGRFVWGVNMLRENILEQKEKELKLLKDKQTLILSVSHDIKTPLSAIKLYAKAMEKGLYNDRDKLLEVAGNINRNANDIETYVNELTRSAGEDFMELEVEVTEDYLKNLIDDIALHYAPVFEERHTEFSVGEYANCLIRCDIYRSREVLKNLMDNAIKYGDGRYLKLEISEEDGCKLVCVANSGCDLPQGEMLHIFDSFYRGSNAGNKPGSGLGLYICRQLMLKMGGDIFAEQKDGEMRITAVFPKA